jgi:tetratricopeptide (TPR) repeat protein
LITYQVDPALEYRTLGHASSPPLNYQRASIRCDGRVLGVGSERGVVLWDLIQGAELAFLPIELAWHTTFEPSGDLLSSGALGVWRWPIRFDPERGEYRIGPPHRLPLPASDCWIDEDRRGRIVALANYEVAHVLTPERAFQVGPLVNCRSVAVSPDGEWLATYSDGGGARIWRVRDAAPVTSLAIDGLVGVLFSPDGKWLMTTNPACRLWAVDTWEQARRIDGIGLAFSPDGRLLVVQDASKVLRLVETETGRTLARLESPDECAVQWATFSPDGSRLVVTTNDAPCVHVWDLRAIRRRLVGMGLDWDAPPFPLAETSTAETEHSTGLAQSREGKPPGEPASEQARQEPRPLGITKSRSVSLKVDVDFGPLKGYSEQYRRDLEQYAVPAEELVMRYTERLRAHPDDPGSLHQRGHALLTLNRFEEALADFAAVSARRPLDAHLRAYQGVCLFNLERYAPALDQLESAFQTDPATVRAIVDRTHRRRIDVILNHLAWELANGAEPRRDPVLAARLAAFAVALSPGEQTSLNTLGVALYRAGKFAEAIETLRKSLESGKGQFDGFDLFFLAMAHHRLGLGSEARACYDRAVDWLGEQKSLSERDAKELADFRAETESVLAGIGGEWPADVFAGPQ